MGYQIERDYRKVIGQIKILYAHTTHNRNDYIVCTAACVYARTYYIIHTDNAPFFTLCTHTHTHMHTHTHTHTHIHSLNSRTTSTSQLRHKKGRSASQSSTHSHLGMKEDPQRIASVGSEIIIGYGRHQHLQEQTSLEPLIGQLPSLCGHVTSSLGGKRRVLHSCYLM